MPEIWLWIGGYAVALVALQVLVYVYYIRQGEGETLKPSTASGEPPPEPRSGAVSPNRNHQPDQSTDGRRCRHCGTLNESDPTYRYCLECGQAVS